MTMINLSRFSSSSSLYIALLISMLISGCGDPTTEEGLMPIQDGSDQSQNGGVEAPMTEGGTSSSVVESMAVCGDGLCQPSESVAACERDCAFCGDQLCNLMETSSSCPLDCNADEQGRDQGPEPEDQSTSICGDLMCDADETAMSCPEDCEDAPSLPPGPAPDSTERVIGHIDNISQRDGRWQISGWACHIGWAPSVEVEIYAGGDAQSGTLIKRELAQDEQESAVGDVCGIQEGQHRFNIPFTDDELTIHAGQPIFMHAVSPIGAEDLPLANSGDFSLPGGPQGGDEVPFELSQVTWLHTDVSQWPVTTTLTVTFQGGEICLEYDKKNVWPPVSIPHSSGNGNVDVVANPWVFLEYQGQWFAGTWEWLAVNRTCRSKTAVAGDHIKKPASVPLDWRPTSGQRLYFMVSALARFSSISNVQERSQIVEVIWP